MREFVGFTITGLVTASIYAVVASGLTLTYATTGIFNWAHGALAAIGAFVYWQCTTLWGWPAPLAMILCVGIIGPVLGVTVESGIMRRLDGTNEITRMAVTLALLVGIIAGINWIWDPQMTKVVLPVFNGKAIEILGQRLPVYDLLVMAVALLVGIVMRWVLYRSRAGVQMRGIVDDRSLIILNGVSPVRTAQTSWVIGSTTAVLAGVLIAPKTSLSAGSLALLIMNAFAASVVGRLRSLPLTILGAAILGLSTAYAQGYVGSRTDLPGGQYLIGLVNVVPVVVLFIALQFLPQERLRAAKSQQARELSSRPTWNGSLWLVVAAVVVTAAIAPLLAPGDLHNMTKLWGVAVIALSLVPLLGWAGRLAVCPFAFAAVGALISAHLAPDGQIWGLVLAGVGAAAVGAILSFPGARLSPLYLALATAAFAVALDNWIFRLPPFHLVIRIPFTEVTLYRHQLDIFQGGSLAMRRPKVFGFDLSGDQAFLIFASIVFGASVLALTALRRSDLGLRMIALKDSPIGYATVGLNRQVTTVAAFAISAGVAGVGGALYGAAMQRPSPDAFNFFSGLSILVIVVVLGASTSRIRRLGPAHSWPLPFLSTCSLRWLR
ncbi:MAG: ABC transporter permease [Microthrixaceae bacterium]